MGLSEGAPNQVLVKVPMVIAVYFTMGLGKNGSTLGSYGAREFWTVRSRFRFSRFKASRKALGEISKITLLPILQIALTRTNREEYTDCKTSKQMSAS